MKRARTADMANDGHVVGWVRNNHLHAFATKKFVVAVFLKGAAAKDFVSSEQPDIAQPGGGVRLEFRHHVVCFFR